MMRTPPLQQGIRVGWGVGGGRKHIIFLQETFPSNFTKEYISSLTCIAFVFTHTYTHKHRHTDILLGTNREIFDGET